MKVSKKKGKNKGGRPTIMTAKTLEKLEESFKKGYSDAEAALAADISEATIYNYQNDHPEFLERKVLLKNNPTLKAKETIFDNLGDPKIAMWLLERKLKDEYSARTEHTGKDGEELNTTTINILTKDEQAIIESATNETTSKGGDGAE